METATTSHHDLVYSTNIIQTPTLGLRCRARYLQGSPVHEELANPDHRAEDDHKIPSQVPHVLAFSLFEVDAEVHEMSGKRL